jgi:galacturan 1,4-alpha-galacturonidase
LHRLSEYKTEASISNFFDNDKSSALYFEALKLRRKSLAMAQRTLLFFLYGTLGLSAAISRRDAKICEVPANENGSDDAPVIVSAFEECGQGGNIVFSDTTYHVNTIMNTTGLSDCEIDIYGALLVSLFSILDTARGMKTKVHQWSDDIDYWLDNSMPIGYQNQSTVWFLGGEGLIVRGHGVGKLDGNGQEWYDFVDGESNYPRQFRDHPVKKLFFIDFSNLTPDRPMGLTIWNSEDAVFEGLRFVQSQM